MTVKVNSSSVGQVFFSALAKRSDTQWPAAPRAEDKEQKKEVQVWRLSTDTVVLNLWTGPVLYLYFRYETNISALNIS